MNYYWKKPRRYNITFPLFASCSTGSDRRRTATIRTPQDCCWERWRTHWFEILFTCCENWSPSIKSAHWKNTIRPIRGVENCSCSWYDCMHHFIDPIDAVPPAPPGKEQQREALISATSSPQAPMVPPVAMATESTQTTFGWTEPQRLESAGNFLMSPHCNTVL